MTGAKLEARFSDILQRYAASEVSAADAAYEIQELKIPGFGFPSASEVILWSKAAGFGIPDESDAEVQEQVARILARMGQREKLH